MYWPLKSRNIYHQHRLGAKYLIVSPDVYIYIQAIQKLTNPIINYGNWLSQGSLITHEICINVTTIFYSPYRSWRALIRIESDQILNNMIATSWLCSVYSGALLLHLSCVVFVLLWEAYFRLSRTLKLELEFEQKCSRQSQISAY